MKPQAERSSLRAAVGQAPVVPLAPADLFQLRFLRGARLSPDGAHVAYVASSTADGAERFELRVRSLADDRDRLAPFAGCVGFPAWSPDGRRLAFVADGAVRVASWPGLEISGPLTPPHLVAQGEPSWAPDGRRLVASLRSPPDVAAAQRRVSDRWRVDGVGLVQGVTQHLYEVAVDRTGARRLSEAAAFCVQPEWSPCGRRILFLASDSPVPYATLDQRLMTLDPQTGVAREVLGRGWYFEAARWTPDGARIVIAASRDSDITIPVVALWAVDVDGGSPSLRSEGVVGNVGCRLNHDMPSKELGGLPLVIADDDTALFSLQRGGACEVWRANLSGPPAARPLLTGERSCLVLDARAAADRLLFAAGELAAPPELRVAALDGGGERTLTDLNGAVLARWPQLSVKPFTFQSADGLGIEGWFLSEAGRTSALPTVLYIHGGPFAATGHGYRFDFHLLASMGFGVAFANFRGSAGYGEAFARAVMGDWGARAYPDHVGAIEAVVRQGWADPDRLGVWGFSHGGFATCWVVGHTQRFKAAVAEASSCNFATLYHLSDIPEVWARDLGGRPHEIPDVYRSRSPITYAHRCRTPTLLIHGEEDFRCPISEAEQFHRALRDAGCETELLRMAGASHTGDSNGPLSARLAQNEALATWFGARL